MKKLFNHQFLMAASTMPCNQFIQKKFMVVVLMMALNSMSVLAATTYNIGNSTLTVNDDNTATLVLGSDFGDFYDWQISGIYGNWASITNLKVTGEATAAAITRLSNQPVANAKRLDYSEVTGVSFTSGINGGWRAVIFPSGTTLTDEMKSSNWDRKYAIVAGETLDVWVINNDGSWVNDVLVQNASSINVDGNSPFDKENDPNVLSLIESGKDVNGSGGGSGGNKVTITELSATSSGNAVATAIQSNLDEGNTIIGLEIGGTLSSDDITAIQNLGTANTVRTLDYSRVENNVNDLPILTSATTILLPGGVSYSNGSVTIGSSTTLDQLSAALKVLKDNGKSFSSVPLPGGSTYSNGELTLSSSDEANLTDIVSALTNAGLSVGSIRFNSGTTYSNGTLTIASSDDTQENIKAKADALRGVSLSITTVNLPNKTSWNNGTITTKSDVESEQNADKAKLEYAGFTVSNIEVSSVSGEYVTEVGGVTILTLPEGVSFQTARDNMTQEEKDALLNAEKLRLVGTFSNDDMNVLKGYTTPQELDLSSAKVPSDFKLPGEGSWYAALTSVILPNDPTFTKIPDNFAINYTGLQSIQFPSQVTEIGEAAFKNTGLTSLKLPNSITTVGNSAFMNCSDLETFEMEILSGTCTFGSNVFESCVSLKHVSLSEGVTEISSHMFDKCGQLESIRIPSTATYIRTGAFEGCASLHSITIPEGVQYIEASAFNNAGLAHVYVMAESATTVPKILAITGSGSNGSTFNSHQVNGDWNSPKESTHTPEEAANLSPEEMQKWYQEDQSNSNYGIGGGECLIQLHYPESMKDFYDGLNSPATGNTSWSSNISSVDKGRKGHEKWDNNATTIAGLNYISEIYALSSGYPDYPSFIDSEENGWPTTPDYGICFAAGYAEGYSNLGWRQFPLKKEASKEDYIFTKEYDDTWYTMCFPWDLEDNQLFNAFNQKCEITEFVGVEVTKTDDPSTEDVIEYSLVFHFDKTAGTYYMTKNHRTDGLEYVRVDDHVIGGQNTTRTETIKIEGGTIEKKYYTYHLIKGSDDNEYVYWPFEGRTSSTAAMCDKYESILHLMVFAGHPYMIHPSIGASPGVPSKCTFAGVTKLQFDTQAEYDKLATDSAVHKKVTTDGTSYHNPGVTEFKNPETGKGGKYYFIGNIRDKKTATDGTVTDTGAKDMLTQSNPAYYLGVPAGQVYPKYYRKTSGGIGKWSQYSAIICPDADALANVEGLDGMAVVKGPGSSAKSFDVAFGEWEIVTPTAINEIIADAERNNEPVKKVHLNVVYNINGQIVREGTTSIEGLPKGLYIVNGKKYMVK